MSDRETLARLLAAAVTGLEACSLDADKWESDYVWVVAPDRIYVSDGDSPEVGVTSVSEELEFLRAAVSDDGVLRPEYLYKLAAVLAAYGAAARSE